mmetsp:Transcript_24616/g.59881  ORF Transcript_24616/g.59881 Transcript_24616/m.59881 type:complete len:267 (-) Transcript_24616:259-1059(-)
MAPQSEPAASFANASPSWTSNREFLATFRVPRPMLFRARPYVPAAPPTLSAGSKVVHFVRHGQGYHNLWAEQSGVRCNCIAGEFAACPYNRPDLVDAALTDMGISQATKLSEADLDPHYPELVVVSPLRRAMQTATYAFPPSPSVPFVALEDLREHIGVHVCDKRFSVTEHKENFPHVSFDELEDDHDAMHSETERETRASMAQRAYNSLQWVAGRPEKSIAVVCHSGILGSIMNSVMECEESKLGEVFKTGEMRSMVVEFEPATK